MKFIGDVVLTTPVIRRLRAHFPQAHIAYLGDAGAVPLLEGNPNLNEILPYDFSRPDWLEQPRVMLALRRRKFDAFVDLFSNPRSALLAWASGAKIRIGKDVKGRGALYTHTIGDDGRRRTAIDFHFQYLEPLGITGAPSGPGDYRTEIVLTAEEKENAAAVLASQDVDGGKPIVALHPGATWPAKKWPKEYFIGLVGALAAMPGTQIVLTQGPKDALLTGEIAGRAEGKAVVLPLLPVRTLAAVLSLCRVYVANDSGPMHISVAVGTRTIGIFGPGEEDIWFPYVPPYRERSAGHVALRHNVPCHPCHLDYCNRSGGGYMECMNGLSVKEVLEAVVRRMYAA